MARITVEDCLQVVPNRFELTLMAAKRARALATSAVDPLVEWDNDKPTVVALREIAAGTTEFAEAKTSSELDFSANITTSGLYGTEGSSEMLGQEVTPDQQAAQFSEGLLAEFNVESADTNNSQVDDATPEE